MKNNIKYILIILFFIIIAIAICLVVYFNLNKKEYVANEVQQNVAVEETTDENVLVVPVEGTGEKEPEPEPEKDAAAWTNEIYNLNIEIGTLTIPKTNLITPIFCKQTADKMEEMPCFIYTTGGLNKKGVTLITGHNKRNGKLFSNNKKLEEGDEFTFKDYEGKELKYTIYSKYITKDTDTSFLSTETDKPVMVLSCCTDANNDDRIIVMGRAE